MMSANCFVEQFVCYIAPLVLIYSYNRSTAAIAVCICVSAVAAPTCGVLTTRPVSQRLPYTSFVGGSCS